MKRLLLLLMLGCSTPPAPFASASFALESALLGRVDQVVVRLEPGEDFVVDDPGEGLFVPLTPGQAVSLELVALREGVEAWRGEAAIPALEAGERHAAEVLLDAVGRIEAEAGEGLYAGREGPEVPLVGAPPHAVLPVGTYALWREGQRVSEMVIEVQQAKVTAWADEPCEDLAPEVCDGRDNDCDEATDEGVANACGGCGEVPEEVCDGLDNDCDGTLDEGTQNDCGGCGVLPQEVCDGLDNDCDGETDEALLNACGTCGDAPVERCNGADEDCDGAVDEGVLNACGRCGDAPVERCNGLDEDCDGAVDEGLLNACGACGALPSERCNGEDDDCDGDTDEGVLNACGGCGQVPFEACDGADNDCDGETDEGALNACGTCGPVPEETCNQVDDDCDGQMDEGTLNACGRCGPVPEEVCDGAVDDDCDGQLEEGLLNACGQCGEPLEERCNGEDEDCDGQTDEGVLNACGDCGEVPEELCNGADDDCDGETDEGVADACGGCGGLPVELCDGEDQDCDGQIDEGTGGAECVIGQGRCLSRGREVCDGQLSCDAEVIEPGEEVCNAVDDDCDGQIDELPEAPCVEGVGACAVEGVLLCERGLSRCLAGPPVEPTEETCDFTDEDCDGQIDEGCPVYESCLDALLQGQTHDGPYLLERGGARRKVWCDQTVDGGGWTLVMATTGAVAEGGAAYQPTLATAAPQEDAPGTWPGLAELQPEVELRFACRAALSEDPGAPFDVDLSLRETALYAGIANQEADCFEAMGVGITDNLSGAIARGVDLVGESACDAEADFAVSLSGRVGGEPEDTAWGLWGGERYCGQQSGADLPGQWLVFGRELRPRGRVAFVGPEPNATLEALGLEAQAPDRYTHDAVWLHGSAEAWAAADPAILEPVSTFSAAGGVVIATGASGNVLSRTVRLMGPALPWYGLQVGTTPPSASTLVATRRDAGLDVLWAGLGQIVQIPGITDAVLKLSMSLDLHEFVTVAEAADADGRSLTTPIIARARRCEGSVVFAGLEVTPEPKLDGLLSNLLAVVTAPTPAYVPDACPPTGRVLVNICGDVASDLSLALPKDGRSQSVCSLEGPPSALLLGRGADVAQLGELAHFVANGGRVITSRGSSAATHLAVFGEDLPLGVERGNCGGGGVEPAQNTNTKHWFWRHNGLEAVNADGQGCGQDLSESAVIGLGGWGEGSVSLGYRDHGLGRVWFVESDWHTPAKLQPATRGMLRYMMAH